jgi:hypothetical protein
MKIKLTEDYLGADSWVRERAKTLLPQNYSLIIFVEEVRYETGHLNSSKHRFNARIRVRAVATA